MLKVTFVNGIPLGQTSLRRKRTLQGAFARLKVHYLLNRYFVQLPVQKLCINLYFRKHIFWIAT